ncbi:hypothetical protein VCV18_003225 [Metarhizium anisopliae]
MAQVDLRKQDSMLGSGDETGQSPEVVSSPQQEHARPRKRTRRACDKCSTSRTRCDGEWQVQLEFFGVEFRRLY